MCEAPTPRARLLALLAGRRADRPACICPGGMMNMVTTELLEAAGASFPEAHADAAQMARLARASYEHGCFENCGVPFCMTVEAEGLGSKVDLGDCRREPRVVSYALEDVGSWGSLAPLDLETGRACTVLEALRILRASRADVPIIGNLTGPVSLAGSLVEPTLLLRAMRREPAAARGLIDFACEQLVAFGRAQAEAGADVVAVSDPSGTAEILGPQLFAAFAVPALNRVVDALHGRGVPVIVHICGRMRAGLSDVGTIHADALSFDAATPLAAVRRALPGRLLMGNVSTYALELAGADAVRAATELSLRSGAGIVAPACGLGMGTPLASIRTLRACVEEWDEGAEGESPCRS